MTQASQSQKTGNGHKAAKAVPITVANGDGIGPEIMSAVLGILDASGAALAPEFIEIGERAYLSGLSSGISDDAWESLRRTKVFLKAPITTPQGGGYKSLNVTVRKTLGLYANVRPVQAFSPYIKTHFPKMDLVIVRENEEDLYAGIEYRQSDDAYHCIKLITRQGCERIVRYAFEYARANGRKKVTCLSKDNIMKMTDGILHKTFDEVAKEYPQIATDHLIIDIGSARIAASPERFDVIVTSNLYGDIISDIAAEVSGSVGLGASLNLGRECAMFEAIHGSAPDISGKDIANPSGLLLASVSMLVHIGQPEVAARVQNAWSKTLEDGIHTADIYQEGFSAKKVGTQEFAKAIIERLGQGPSRLPRATFATGETMKMPEARKLERPAEKTLVGIDVYVSKRQTTEPHGTDVAESIASAVQAIVKQRELPFELKLITNRGVKLWPNGYPETFCCDTWRCRLLAPTQRAVNNLDIAALIQAFASANIQFVKTEHLYNFDGAVGYSLGQGQ
jgi:isocitrate dehydrogenase